MDIQYNTPATKYTGALQGSYKGDLPPVTSEYTKLIKSILDGSEMPVPYSELLKNIYKLFGGDIDVNPPESRLSELLQYSIYTDRYTITDKTDNSITIYDSETSESKTLYLDNNLESIWADIIKDGAVLKMVRFITADNEYFMTADNEYFLVEE